MAPYSEKSVDELNHRQKKVKLTARKELLHLDNSCVVLGEHVGIGNMLVRRSTSQFSHQLSCGGKHRLLPASTGKGSFSAPRCRFAFVGYQSSGGLMTQNPSSSNPR